MRLSFFLVIGLILFPLVSNAQKWSRYSFKDAKFSIEYPVEPVTETKTDDIGKTITTKLVDGNTIYMATAIIHKTNLNVKGLSQESLAKASMDAFADALGATKVTRKKYYYKKDVGLDAIMESNEFESPIYYRIIVVEQIQYQIVVMTSSGKEDKGGRKKFLGSFKLDI
jgi:hypothetical protein